MPLTGAQKVIALMYIGEGKHNAKSTSTLTLYTYSYVKRIVKQPHVMKFMDEELRAMGIVARSVRKDIILETVRLAQSSLPAVLKECMDDNGDIDPVAIRDLPHDIGAAVKGLKVVKTTRGSGKDQYVERRTEVIMHDKQGALNLAEKMLQISQDRPEEKQGELDELKLMGMVIEGPGGVILGRKDAIDVDFSEVKIEEDDDSWLALPAPQH